MGLLANFIADLSDILLILLLVVLICHLIKSLSAKAESQPFLQAQSQAQAQPEAAKDSKIKAEFEDLKRNFIDLAGELRRHRRDDEMMKYQALTQALVQANTQPRASHDSAIKAEFEQLKKNFDELSRELHKERRDNEIMKYQALAQVQAACNRRSRGEFDELKRGFDELSCELRRGREDKEWMQRQFEELKNKSSDSLSFSVSANIPTSVLGPIFGLPTIGCRPGSSGLKALPW